ncbi:MAG: hypothetical protein AAF725_07750 [Acidobacteriota bacterium]
MDPDLLSTIDRETLARIRQLLEELVHHLKRLGASRPGASLERVFSIALLLLTHLELAGGQLTRANALWFFAGPGLFRSAEQAELRLDHLFITQFYRTHRQILRLKEENLAAAKALEKALESQGASMSLGGESLRALEDMRTDLELLIGIYEELEEADNVREYTARRDEIERRIAALGADSSEALGSPGDQT